ncbi:MAG TPA: hypothetical protein VKQ72_08040, partial [Aggregatilineales bacterium]|nr:hypothetical protein [Aggregatilineales bacterium]
AEGSNDGTINIWGTHGGKRLCSFVANVGSASPGEGTLGGVTALAWSPDGQYLASGGYDGKADVWEVRNTCAEQRYQWEISRGWSVSLLSWSANAHQILLSDGTDIRLYSSTSGELIHTFPSQRRTFGLSRSSDGFEVALLRDNGEAGQIVELRDAATFQLYLIIEGIPCQTPASIPLVWSPDGQEVATICDGKATFWNTRTGKAQTEIGTNVAALAWSPDGHQIATVGADGMIHLWAKLP